MYRFVVCLLLVCWLVALSAEAKFTHEHHVCTLANGLSRAVLRIFGPREDHPEPWRLKALADQLRELTKECPGLREEDQARKRYERPGESDLDQEES